MTERDEPEPAEESARVDMPAVDDGEPAVEGVAVELPDEAPAPAVEPPPAPSQTPEPPPVMPVTIHAPPTPPSRAPAPSSNPIVDVSAAPSSTPSYDGHAAEPPMNPVGEIAATRPELLVGAAFAGGILAAMILRRLGN
ncbi:MAG: hypothetical protein WKF48_07275 [Solirubrobacteraceae bacterium]